jgi:hypothetical protein
MTGAWKTKYGMRRVRRDDPTLDEAIFAARGLTDNVREQAEIAAALMGLPVDEVLVEVAKTGAQRHIAVSVGGAGAKARPRMVVVEHRTMRRPASSGRHR